VGGDGAAARLLPSPFPLAGEGWGGGCDAQYTPAISSGDEIPVGGISLVANPAGALYWPEQGALIVADLHLEKGSSFARRGTFLPPYDTAATLQQLAALIAHYAPRLVIALGDSFHDGDGPARLSDVDRDALRALQRGRAWMWLAGNHDADPAPRVGGDFAAMLAIAPIMFRHEPAEDIRAPEIAGHLHPVARVSGRGRAVSRKCFAGNGMRLVMPAFGAYTGGLNVRDRAFAALFDTLAFTAHLLGRDRLYAVAAARCMPD
jgi:DNA ligase-associated metallophosphoesterase